MQRSVTQLASEYTQAEVENIFWDKECQRRLKSSLPLAAVIYGVREGTCRNFFYLVRTT